MSKRKDRQTRHDTAFPPDTIRYKSYGDSPPPCGDLCHDSTSSDSDKEDEDDSNDSVVDGLSIDLSNNASISSPLQRRSSCPNSTTLESSIYSAPTSPPTNRTPAPSSSLSILVICSLAFAVLLVTCGLVWRLRGAPSTKPDRESDLQTTKIALHDAFPSQPNATWAAFAAVLRPLMRATSDAPPPRPAIVLLVGPPRSATLACLTTRLGGAAATLLAGSTCRSVTATGNDLASEDARKLALDREVLGAYKRGELCFQFNDLERLSKQQLLLLHAWCDGDHSPVKHAFFLLVLHMESDLSERGVERFLMSLWRPKVGDDEAGALNSRLANNVLIVREEEALQDDKCVNVS